jgi:hypothetical protein
VIAGVVVAEPHARDNGREVWGAGGYASFDGGEPVTFALSRLDGGVVKAVDLRRQQSGQGLARAARHQWPGVNFNGAVAPEILDATGFPVTAFVRRDGTVAAIHTGFISKAAGPEHAAAVKLLESYVQQIVKSP